MESLLHKINTLKSKLDQFSPIKKEYKEVLWDKFRLEWNYNSNHIEGNTMTYGETQLLLRLGDDFKAQNNSLKDVNEMRAHDSAIFIIREWAKGTARKLTEKDIRELNKIILVKDYWADAQTTEGKPTRRLIEVGKYKKYPNHVELKDKTIFRYAEPNEVSFKMNDLVSWYNANQEEHPLIVATYLHYNFVIIHPFDDGNGRVSRLLMNYHLMQNGFPPIIIKSNDKSNYLYALNQADSGNKKAFVEYIGEQLVWSLETAIKAAQGESIEEKDDLFKEIEIWKKQLTSGLPTAPKRQNLLCEKIYTESISKLFGQIVAKATIFKDLFLTHNFEKGLKEVDSNSVFRYPFDKKVTFNPEREDNLERFQLLTKLHTPLNNVDTKNSLVSGIIIVDLNVFDYSFKINGREQSIIKQYNENLTDDEINSLTKVFINDLFEEVKIATQL